MTIVLMPALRRRSLAAYLREDFPQDLTQIYQSLSYGGTEKPPLVDREASKPARLMAIVSEASPFFALSYRLGSIQIEH
jgi:hypothetical protein